MIEKRIDFILLDRILGHGKQRQKCEVLPLNLVWTSNWLKKTLGATKWNHNIEETLDNAKKNDSFLGMLKLIWDMGNITIKLTLSDPDVE